MACLMEFETVEKWNETKPAETSPDVPARCFKYPLACGEVAVACKDSRNIKDESANMQDEEWT